LLRGRVEATCVDNILIVEFRNTTKCIFQDLFCHCDRQVLLSETEEMIVEVLENEHILLRDGVFDEADMVSATP
jgi:hypothetical protein